MMVWRYAARLAQRHSQGQVHLRLFASVPEPSPKPTGPATGPVTRLRIFHSNSTDIIHNLALEDWLSRKNDHAHTSTLLTWRNEPTVVIGRNQNPWVECNFSALHEMGVSFVRRRSGGGTVYHDMGNLNISFITSRQNHAPLVNSTAIAHALETGWGVKAIVSPRNDLFIDGFKVSGSAYRLTSSFAYHHCTLLLNADLLALYRLLHVKESRKSIESKGIESVRSNVTNINRLAPTITYETARAAIEEAFVDCNKQLSVSASQMDVEHVTLDPSDSSSLPGIQDFIDEFKSWDWRYGQSPTFAVDVTHRFHWGQLSARIETRRCAIEALSFTAVELPPTLVASLEGLALGIPHSKAGYGALGARWLEASPIGYHKQISDLVAVFSGLVRHCD